MYKLATRMSNIIQKPLNEVNKINNKVVGILENPFIKYGFLIFIALRIYFIDRMQEWYLDLFTYTSVKVIYALLVAYSACFDPVYAIALTTFIVICIQEAYNRKRKYNVNTKPFNMDGNRQQVVYNSLPDKQTLETSAQIFNEINKHTMQRIPDTNDKLITQYDYYDDPAFKTLTANIENKLYLGNNKFYITDENLQQIQHNQQPNVNQNSVVEVFPDILNAQGLPNGFDKGVGGSNPELSLLSSIINPSI